VFFSNRGVSEVGDHYIRKKCSVFINRGETEVEVFGFLFFF